MTESELLSSLEDFRKCADQEMINTGKTFQFTSENTDIIIGLIKYIKGFESPLDPNKGLLFTGQRGQGKTTLMLTIGRMAAYEYRMVMAMAHNVGLTYKLEGPQMFKNYKVNFIDDILREDEFYSHYSEQLDVIKFLIGNHYKLWQRHGVRLNLTANGNSDDIKRRYGDRDGECVIDMTNQVIFEGQNWRLHQ